MLAFFPPLSPRRLSRRRFRRTFAFAASAIVTFAPHAGAEERPGGEVAVKGSALESLDVAQLQYGVAIAAEIPFATGPICDPNAPCILGAGGGPAIRIGLRATKRIYAGFAYELSKQDSSKLFRLAIFQQARFEGRYYLHTTQNIEPFAALNLGIAGYGNEWAVSTWGPVAGAGIGVEIQASRSTVFGIVLNYRAVRFGGFTDTSGTVRDAGISHLVGLEISIEGRDPI